MRCPSLNELPPPPAGKTGWPWTEASPALPERMPSGDEWPRISIVTPNYNYGHFLEETIRSILLQGYPDIQYIITDGMSVDNSVEVIKKYEKWLDYWVSEKDKGQTNAINKGLRRCRGEIFNWINSDDQLFPGALFEIARLWNKHQHPDMLVGNGMSFEVASGKELYRVQPKIIKKPWDLIKYGQVGLGISQSNAFFKLSVVRDIGYLKEDLEYCFDWALYLQVVLNLRQKFKMSITSALISKSLVHCDAKTVKNTSSFAKEGYKFLQEIYPKLSWVEKIQVNIWKIQYNAQSKVIEALKDSPKDLRKLVKLLLRYPSVCFSKFFWGALRRIIW